MNYDSLFTHRLEALDRELLLRTEKAFSGAGPLTVCPQTQRRVLSFGSNDYLGLSTDPRTLRAAAEALQRYGVGATGSRLTTGTFELHQVLEARLAALKGSEDCLVFTSGYAANTGILQALCDKSWHVFSDRLNHASLVDGAAAAGRLSRYRHLDMADLAGRLAEATESCRLIATDGVFSMDGDLAPLPDIVALADAHDALVMVDDAHGLGVLGADGMGTVSHYQMKHRVAIQMGTFSKAAGALGGYVAGSRQLIALLRSTARPYIFTTALPPAMAAAAMEALTIISEEPERRLRLTAMADALRCELRARGFQVLGHDTPILPVITGSAEATLALAEKLWTDGLYTPAIRPPSVPRGTGRLRITVTAAHTAAHLDRLLEALTYHGRSLGILGGP